MIRRAFSSKIGKTEECNEALGKIPCLSLYLISELLNSSSTSAAQAFFQIKVADISSWLFPEEAETIIGGNEFDD